MKKLSNYQLRKIKINLKHYFHQSNVITKPIYSQYYEGYNWYEEANKECLRIAKNPLYCGAPNKLDVYKVAAVISALSPRNKWHRNLIDAENLIDAYFSGLTPDDVKVCTFNKNKLKAWSILEGKNVLTNNSLKTFNFLNNLAYLCEESVTIDIWYFRACFNNMQKIDRAKIGRLAYEQIRKLTIELASEYNLKGYQFQAVVWTVIRNKNKSRWQEKN